ncbi:hypothetical protein, partial [Niabella drilacis]
GLLPETTSLNEKIALVPCTNKAQSAAENRIRFARKARNLKDQAHGCTMPITYNSSNHRRCLSPWKDDPGYRLFLF